MTVELALTTIERLKKRLAILHDDDDDDLEFLILAASRAVVNYLDTRADAVLDLDSSGDLPSGVEIPPEVEAATLYLAGVMYRNKDGADPDFVGTSLPYPVIAFLRPLRDIPIA